MKELTAEYIANMTQEEKLELASQMYCPVKWCGSSYFDSNGNRWFIHGKELLSQQEHNQVMNDAIRKANPKWSEEQLKPYLW